MSGIVKTVGKVVDDVKKIQPFKKPLSILKPIMDVAEIAAGASGIGGVVGGSVGKVLTSVGGSLGGLTSKITGSLKLGGTLGQVFGEDGLINIIGSQGMSNLMDGSPASMSLMSMITGSTTSTEAQQAFLKMALQGGMTSDEIASNNQFRDLVIKGRETDLQTAEAGLNAFKQAAAEMSEAGRKLDNVTFDKSGTINILDRTQMIQNEQLNNARSVATPTNTQAMQEASGTQSAASSSASSAIKKGWGAVQGILSSYGGREVSDGVGGTSLGQPPRLEFGMSKASGVKIGDETDAARQTLERQILEAKAAGATAAQLAALRTRGELAIQQEAARVNASNEQQGSKAYYDAVSGMANLNSSASGIGSAQAAQEAMVQQLDTAKKQVLNDMYNQLVTQGLNQADIAMRLEQASTALEVQKQQAVASIQSNIGSMNVVQYQSALQNAMTGLSQLGVNIGHQLATTTGALNATGGLLSSLSETERNMGAASADGGTSYGGGLDENMLSDILGGIGKPAAPVPGSMTGWVPGESGINNITVGNGNYGLTIPDVFQDKTKPVSPLLIGSNNQGNGLTLKYGGK